MQQRLIRLATLTALLGCWALLLPTTRVAAQQLGVYTFTGVTSCVNPPVDAGSHPNATFSVFSSGSGLTCPGTYGSGHYNRSGAESPNLNGVDYFQFSITPDVNYVMNLSSLVFYARRSGTGAPRWAIRSNLDNFGQNYTSGYMTVSGADSLLSINLSPNFDNQTGIVTFRIYMWGASSTAGTFRVDSVSLNGTIVSGCAPDATVQSANVTGCFGNTNGSISIRNATGGSGQNQYSIDGGANWQADSTFAVAANSYNVQIRDAQSPACVRILNANLVITEPTEMTATASALNANCATLASGRINVTSPSGGSGQYEYSIDGGLTFQASGVFNNVAGGNYDVRMRDAANPTCVEIVNVSLAVLAPDTLDAALIINPITCHNGLGAITFSNPMGGSGLFDYSIDGGQNWQANGAFGNLAPGTYNVQIRDRAVPACFVVLNANVVFTNPGELEAQLDTRGPACPGGSNGSINFLNESGGSGSYEFSIDGGQNWQASPSFINLAPGNYNIQMRDANATNCVKILNSAAQLLPVDTLSASFTNTNAQCDGGTGLLEIINVSGGSGLYEFSLDEGVTWSSAVNYNLPAGTYIITVRDASSPSCPVYILPTMAEINSPAPVPVPTTQNVAICGPGAVTLSATGTGTLNWYADDTTSVVLGSGASFTTPSLTATTNYYVAAFDGTCSSARVLVAAVINPLPTPSFTANPTSVAAGGSVQFTYTGSAASSFNWTIGGTSFSSSQSPSHIFTTAGNFDVVLTVTDANGCSATTAATSITVTPPTSVNPDNAQNSIMSVALSPNPAAAFVQLSAPALAGQPLSVEVLDIAGRVVLLQAESAFSGHLSLDMQHLPAALYLVRVQSQGQSATHKLLLVK